MIGWSGPSRASSARSTAALMAVIRCSTASWIARQVDTLHPGQTREQRRASLAAAEGNRTIPRFALLWNALRALVSPDGPQASGWVSVQTEQTKHGPVRLL